MVRGAPGEAIDALLVDLIEHDDWSLRIPEIPNLQFRNSFVIVSDCNLSGYLRIPRETHFSIADGTAVLETENRFIGLEVPNHGQSILTGGCQNVLDLPVPGDGSDWAVIVKIRMPWTENGWVVEILGDVHDLLYY